MAKSKKENKVARYGDLNPFQPQFIEEVKDLEDSSPWMILQKIVEKFSSPNVLEGKDSFLGIILREETPGENKLQRFKVRIPEIHLHLVPPKKMGKQASREDNFRINLHPTFVASSVDTFSGTSGKEGVLVRCSFQDFMNQMGGVIEEVVDPKSYSDYSLPSKISAFDYFRFRDYSERTSNQGSGSRLPISSEDNRRKGTPPKGVKPGEFRPVPNMYQNVPPYNSIVYQAPHCSTYKRRQKEDLPPKAGGTIQTAGCGVIALSMVLNGYGIKYKSSPAEIAESMVKHGLRGCADGTHPSAFRKLPDWQPYVEGVLVHDFKKVLEMSQRENVLGHKGISFIAATTGVNSKRNKVDRYNFFTSRSHYVVISGYKNGKFRVFNPVKGGRAGWVAEKYIKQDVDLFYAIIPKERNS